MNLDRQNRLLVQKYKIAREELEIVKSVYESGMRDLNAHLDLLKDELSSKIKNQKERFEKNFFSSEENKNKSEEEVSKNEKPKWAKKLFREVVMMTHPDKTCFVPVESVREKFSKYYNLAVESYNCESYEDLVFVGADIGIDIDPQIVEENISPKLKYVNDETEKLKRTIAYQWAHIENVDKVELLKNYLQSLGYVFDKKEVKEVIEKFKRIKRKKGTRPVNYIRQRIK